MRTTLVIDDDVLEAARSLAEAEGKSVGEVISILARRGVPQDKVALAAAKGSPNQVRGTLSW